MTFSNSNLILEDVEATVKNSLFKRTDQAISVKEGTLKVEDSAFEELDDSAMFGSGIHTTDTNITVERCEFRDSQASNGGALALLCNEENHLCNFSIRDSVFESL